MSLKRITKDKNELDSSSLPHPVFEGSWMTTTQVKLTTKRAKTRDSVQVFLLMGIIKINTDRLTDERFSNVVFLVSVRFPVDYPFRPQNWPICSIAGSVLMALRTIQYMGRRAEPLLLHRGGVLLWRRCSWRRGSGKCSKHVARTGIERCVQR